MGDEERSKEAEQETEKKEMKTVLQCPPIYPLPEEIKKMQRSETVCRYCGVSYLIFHEFHQLHTRMAQLEEELQGLRETTQREKAQREALELGRLEWEKAFRLDVQRQTEEKEKSTREALEERHREAERALREETARKIKEENQKISDEKERQVRRELGELQAETLRKQREELERIEVREKVLSDALQKANKNVGEQRKHLQQLEERLAKAAHTEEEAGQVLKKEMRQAEILRGACVRQQQALRATLSLLRSSGSELADVRGFFSQLTGVWQAFRSQILQHSTQVFSGLREELKHSSAELRKMREEKERLTQQLMEQRRQHEEKLSQQKYSENQHKGKLLRLKEEELDEEHKRMLSCQRRCDIMQEQLSSYCAAEEEAARLREALEKVQQEARELRREREILTESHGRALIKMEEDCRQQMSSKLAAALEEQRAQNALHLREQMEEFRGEAELELTIDREKNKLTLLQYQRDSTQLQEKLEETEQVLNGLHDELQEERGSRVEERKRREEERKRREEEIRQELQQVLHGLQDELQEERGSREEERKKREEERKRKEEEIRQELQRSQQQEAQAKAGLQLVAQRNAELQEEVALLQETVRMECEEREELTAALSRAQEELLDLRSQASHQGSSRSPPNPIKIHSPPGYKHFHPHCQTRVTLTRSLNSPNALRPAPPSADKDRGQGTDGGGAGRGVESWNRDEKRREGTLPRLRASSTVSEVKRKVSLATDRKERL